MEENILAILDASEAKDNQDADDDSTSFYLWLLLIYLSGSREIVPKALS